MQCTRELENRVRWNTSQKVDKVANSENESA